jgi:hypothetical protein
MATTTTTNTYGANNPYIPTKGVESKHKSIYGLGWPFVRPKNRVVETEDIKISNESSYVSKEAGVALIKNNVKQLLSTTTGERLMLPDFGVELEKYLFEPADETTFSMIKEEVSAALDTYFDTVKIIALRVMSPIGQNSILIELTLQVLDESYDMFDIEVKVG